MVDDEILRLFTLALDAHEDSQERWIRTRALSARGDRATLDAAADWLSSPDPAARVMAADVLSQFGCALERPLGEDTAVQTLPFWTETCRLVNARLALERDPGVLRALIGAAGRLHDPRSTPLLLAHCTHGDQFVRWAVVMALSERAEDAAADALVEMLADPSPLVRDWAAFAFGVTMPSRDGLRLQAALAAMLSDDDLLARSEAMRALVVRGAGELVVDALLATLPHATELENTEPLEAALLGAAAQTGDLRLRDHVLIRLRNWDADTEPGDEEPLPEDLMAALARYADGGGP